ncbi:outer membrane protein assembly factor BamB [Endozoicomonas gorgoniicola]|uniref:Outer membrane protein assembly factor BamB n=1 Tax=Endozoicomonas gorgoniicola TaxID=1234144 RepID=A0ABT3MRA0_9GAMM|nr:outer membrane protein assembly factor BamB [Endozoicomonas gorgoniicola]MCW7551900.1 outer membrane protein assembly factor BamB [Endozoicomonas gorgoniicola]
MERFFRSLLVVTLSLGLTACGMFSKDEEEIRTPKPLTSFEASVEMKQVWSQSIGEGVQGGYEQLKPSVFGDVIYSAGAEGSITALEVETGKRVWNRKLGVQVGGGINAMQSMLLLGTLDGRVLALSAEDGSDLWETRVSSEVISVPQVSGDTVVVQTIDDTVTAINAENGKIIWVQENLQPALTLRGSSSPRIENGAVFAGFHSGEARAYRIEDGTPLWVSKVALPKGSSELERMVDINASPLIVGDSVFMVSYQGNAAALDMYSGRVRWNREISSYKSMSSGFGSLYLTDQDSYVSSIDQRTGAVGWRQDQLEYRQVSAPAAYSSYVAVGDLDGYVHLLSQVDGSMVGRYKVGTAIKAQPVSAGDLLFVLDAKGKLYALDRK